MTDIEVQQFQDFITRFIDQSQPDFELVENMIEFHHFIYSYIQNSGIHGFNDFLARIQPNSYINILFNFKKIMRIYTQSQYASQQIISLQLSQLLVYAYLHTLLLLSFSTNFNQKVANSYFSDQVVQIYLDCFDVQEDFHDTNYFLVDIQSLSLLILLNLIGEYQLLTDYTIKVTDDIVTELKQLNLFNMKQNVVLQTTQYLGNVVDISKIQKIEPLLSNDNLQQICEMCNSLILHQTRLSYLQSETLHLFQLNVLLLSQCMKLAVSSRDFVLFIKQEYQLSTIPKIIQLLDPDNQLYAKKQHNKVFVFENLFIFIKRLYLLSESVEIRTKLTDSQIFCQMQKLFMILKSNLLSSDCSEQEKKQNVQTLQEMINCLKTISLDSYLGISFQSLFHSFPINSTLFVTNDNNDLLFQEQEMFEYYVLEQDITQYPTLIQCKDSVLNLKASKRKPAKIHAFDDLALVMNHLQNYYETLLNKFIKKQSMNQFTFQQSSSFVQSKLGLNRPNQIESTLQFMFENIYLKDQNLAVQVLNQYLVGKQQNIIPFLVYSKIFSSLFSKSFCYSENEDVKKLSSSFLLRLIDYLDQSSTSLYLMLLLKIITQNLLNYETIILPLTIVDKIMSSASFVGNMTFDFSKQFNVSEIGIQIYFLFKLQSIYYQSINQQQQHLNDCQLLAKRISLSLPIIFHDESLFLLLLMDDNEQQYCQQILQNHYSYLLVNSFEDYALTKLMKQMNLYFEYDFIIQCDYLQVQEMPKSIALIQLLTFLLNSNKHVSLIQQMSKSNYVTFLIKLLDFQRFSTFNIPKQVNYTMRYNNFINFFYPSIFMLVRRISSIAMSSIPYIVKQFQEIQLEFKSINLKDFLTVIPFYKHYFAQYVIQKLPCFNVNQMHEVVDFLIEYTQNKQGLSQEILQFINHFIDANQEHFISQEILQILDKKVSYEDQNIINLTQRLMYLLSITSQFTTSEIKYIIEIMQTHQILFVTQLLLQALNNNILHHRHLLSSFHFNETGGIEILETNSKFNKLMHFLISLQIQDYQIKNEFQYIIFHAFNVMDVTNSILSFFERIDSQLMFVVQVQNKQVVFDIQSWLQPNIEFLLDFQIDFSKTGIVDFFLRNQSDVRQQRLHIDLDIEKSLINWYIGTAKPIIDNEQYVVVDNFYKQKTFPGLLHCFSLFSDILVKDETKLLKTKLYDYEFQQQLIQRFSQKNISKIILQLKAKVQLLLIPQRCYKLECMNLSQNVVKTNSQYTIQALTDNTHNISFQLQQIIQANLRLGTQYYYGNQFFLNLNHFDKFLFDYLGTIVSNQKLVNTQLISTVLQFTEQTLLFSQQQYLNIEGLMIKLKDIVPCCITKEIIQYLFSILTNCHNSKFEVLVVQFLMNFKLLLESAQDVVLYVIDQLMAWCDVKQQQKDNCSKQILQHCLECFSVNYMVEQFEVLLSYGKQQLLINFQNFVAFLFEENLRQTTQSKIKVYTGQQDQVTLSFLQQIQQCSDLVCSNSDEVINQSNRLRSQIILLCQLTSCILSNINDEIRFFCFKIFVSLQQKLIMKQEDIEALQNVISFSDNYSLECPSKFGVLLTIIQILLNGCDTVRSIGNNDYIICLLDAFIYYSYIDNIQFVYQFMSAKDIKEVNALEINIGMLKFFNSNTLNAQILTVQFMMQVKSQYNKRFCQIVDQVFFQKPTIKQIVLDLFFISSFMPGTMFLKTLSFDIQYDSVSIQATISDILNQKLLLINVYPINIWIKYMHDGKAAKLLYEVLKAREIIQELLFSYTQVMFQFLKIDFPFIEDLTLMYLNYIANTRVTAIPYYGMCDLFLAACRTQNGTAFLLDTLAKCELQTNQLISQFFVDLLYQVTFQSLKFNRGTLMKLYVQSQSLESIFKFDNEVSIFSNLQYQSIISLIRAIVLEQDYFVILFKTLKLIDYQIFQYLFLNDQTLEFQVVPFYSQYTQYKFQNIDNQVDFRLKVLQLSITKDVQIDVKQKTFSDISQAMLDQQLLYNDRIINEQDYLKQKSSLVSFKLNQCSSSNLVAQTNVKFINYEDEIQGELFFFINDGKIILFFKSPNCEYLIQVHDFQHVRYLFEWQALLIYDFHNSFLFDFVNTPECKKFFDLLVKYLVVPKSKQKVNIFFQDHNSTKLVIDYFQKASYTRLWQSGIISNYDYLLLINFAGSRSFNATSQYPVFPWIFNDYFSPSINTEDPNVYRDFSLPIGSQAYEQKINHIHQKFRDTSESIRTDQNQLGSDNNQSADYVEQTYRQIFETKTVFETFACTNPLIGNPFEHQQMFHHGYFYSNETYVLLYLIRLQPFMRMAIDLQNGKLDKDRAFNSIADTFIGIMKNNQDNRELIPEFFTLPEMFKDVNNTGLGDVKLPPWAETPEQFVSLHRKGLESSFVSQNLHLWIDLIFGFRQQGLPAVDKLNTFGGQIFYESQIRGLKLSNNQQKEYFIDMARQTAKMFGHAPAIVFNQPHPAKFDSLQPKSPHVQKELYTTNEQIISVFRMSETEVVIETKMRLKRYIFESNIENLLQINRCERLTQTYYSVISDKLLEEPFLVDKEKRVGISFNKQVSVDNHTILNLIDSSLFKRNIQILVKTNANIILLRAGFKDGSILVQKLHPQNFVKAINLGTKATAVSQFGAEFLVGCDDGSLFKVSVEQSVQVVYLCCFDGQISSIAWHGAQNLVAIATLNSICLLDCTLKLLVKRHISADYVAFYQQNLFVVKDHTIGQYLPSLTQIESFELLDTPIYDITLSKNNILLLAADAVFVISLRSMKLVDKYLLQTTGKAYCMNLFYGDQVLTFVDESNKVKCITGTF